MAEIVAGFLLPHVPLMTEMPHLAPEEDAAVAWRSFDEIAKRMRDARVDTVITVGADHYGMFGPQCIPQCLIGIGDVEGPMESWLGIPRAGLPDHAPLARHLVEAGLAEGIPWSFSSSLLVDHATAVPLHLCYRQVPGVRIVPVYLNAAVAPVIPNRIARSVGESIGRAVASWPGRERVAIVGTGGCSHWVGSAEMGTVNAEFDARLIGLVTRGDLDGLEAIGDAEVLAQAGNGALEIKNWICAMAAARCASAELIAYRTVPDWVSGLCFAELRQAA